MSNPASPVKYPLPFPTPVVLPAVGPAPASPAKPLNPNAAVAPNAAHTWPPADFDMSSTNCVARVWPVAGGNSVKPSEVPASQIAGPAEAFWSASKDPARAQAIIAAVAAAQRQYPNARPWPLDKK